MTNNNHLLIVYGTKSLAGKLALHEILTPDERADAERLRGQGQKGTWVSCRAALRLILASYLSLHPQKIEFRKANYGKPYIADSNLFFNVSHSNQAFLIGFNFLGRIGVDIEKLSGCEDLPSLMNYAFSGVETDYCNQGIVNVNFTEVWTLKEAFLKAVGVGLIDQLKTVTVKGSTHNCIDELNLNQKSFICPNAETGSVVYRKDQTIRYIQM